MSTIGALFVHACLVMSFRHTGQGLPDKSTPAFIYLLGWAVLIVTARAVVTQTSVIWTVAGVLCMACAILAVTGLKRGFGVASAAVLANTSEVVVLGAVELAMGTETAEQLRSVVLLWAGMAVATFVRRSRATGQF